jgi:hypothetical protein
MFNITYGVRQGSVLSPHLFAIYINDIMKRFTLNQRLFIVIYADDILLIAPSVNELQVLYNLCEMELAWLDMNINVKNYAVCVSVIGLIVNVRTSLHKMECACRGLPR